MKVIVFSVLAAAVATAFTVVEPQKPKLIELAVPPVPMVKIPLPGESVGTFCPAVGNVQQSIDVPVVDENGAVVTIHCRDCQLGVYFKNEQDKHVCTYCQKEMN